MTKGKAFSIAWALIGILLLANPVWGAAGDQLWSTSFNFSSYSFIQINALSVSQSSVILCGNASGGTDPLAPMQIGFIKAFDVATGIIKWEKTLSLGSMENDLTGLTVDGNVAIAVGTAHGFTIDNPPDPRYVLRAYDANSGALLWEDQNNCYGGAVAPSSYFKPFVAVSNNRVFLAVLAYDNALPGDCVVRAFLEKNVSIPLSLLLE